MILDDGYQFGLGAFETIAVENGAPLLLAAHLERLHKTLRFFGIDTVIQPDFLTEAITKEGMTRGAVKLMVSARNTSVTFRANPYTQADYERGFRLRYSNILRNDTSPLTYHKTLNYGDCVLEKRGCAAAGYDEAIFRNRRGEICEGTRTNIFFVKDGCIYTPALSCGLLPGILRGYLMERYELVESSIRVEDVQSFDECFVTNSLMGIMPVCSLGEMQFSSRDMAIRLQGAYLKEFHISEIL